MATINLPNNWRPREYQRSAFNHMIRAEKGGRAVCVWHRRAGKDDFCLHLAAVKAHQNIGNYWHMLPEYSQARKAIWDAVNPHTGKRRIDEAFPLELRATTREQEMQIVFKNGSTWQVVGSDSYNKLVGSTPRGVVFSEYSIANPAAWAYIRPILAENGGWAAFIYTPRGRNHGWTMYDQATKNDGWFAQKLTADDTGVFEPAILENERQEFIATYGDDEGDSFFRQEYHCSFDAALLGAIWGKWIERAETEGRVGLVPVDKFREVFTAWDIGYSDDTAIWFFQLDAGGALRIIDYYSKSGQAAEHYATVLMNRGYNYGRHYLPHDAWSATIQGAGKSVMAQLKAHGLQGGFERVPREDVQAGIQAARYILPKCYFDKVKTKDGVECLRNYQRKWDDSRKCFSENPVHDWASHGSDAFRYLALAWHRETRKEPEKAKPRFLHEMTAHDVFFGEASGIGKSKRTRL